MWMRFCSDNKIVMYDLSDTPFQNNAMSYRTLLPCYIALFGWHPTRSLERKLQRVKPCQTMLLWKLLFYLLICVYLCQMSWLACRVIIPVPCHHLFTRFPMEGHKILCKHIGATTSWQPYWCSKMMKWWPYWCTKPILWEFNSFLNICKHYLLFQ